MTLLTYHVTLYSTDETREPDRLPGAYASLEEACRAASVEMRCHPYYHLADVRCVETGKVARNVWRQDSE